MTFNGTFAMTNQTGLQISVLLFKDSVPNIKLEGILHSCDKNSKEKLIRRLDFRGQLHNSTIYLNQRAMNDKHMHMNVWPKLYAFLLNPSLNKTNIEHKLKE